MKPVSISIIFCADDSALFSRLIQRITNSQWSHVALAFDFDNGTTEYYECLFSEGVTGPKDISRLLSWRDRSPQHRAAIVCLHLPVECLEQKLATAQGWVGKKGYSKFQILVLWYFERVGRFFGMQVPDMPRRFVCSEFLGRDLQPQLDLRDPIHNTWDVITPGSIWDRLIEIHQRISSEIQFAAAIGTGLASQALHDAPRLPGQKTATAPASAPSVQSALCSRQNAARSGDPSPENPKPEAP